MATDYIKQLLHASSVALYGNEAVTTGDVTFSKFQDNGGEPSESEIVSCNSVKENEGIVSTKANISDSMMKGTVVEGVPLFQDTQLKNRKSKKIKGPHCFKSRDFTVSKVTDKPKNRVDEGASCIQESLSSSVVSLGGDSGVNIKKKKKGKKDKDGTGHVPQSNTNDSDILMEANTSDSKLRESMDKNVSLSVSKKCKKICKENDASTVVAVKSTDAKVTKVRKQSNKKIKDAASNSILELIAASMVALYGDFGSKLEKPKKVQDVHGQNLKQTIENDHQALSKVNALSSDFQTKVVEDNSLRVCKINAVPIEVQHDKAVSDSLSNKKLAKKNKVKQNKKKKSESFSQIIHDCSQASISSNKKKKKEKSKHKNDAKKTISKDDRGSINEIFITDSLTVKEETILPDLIDNAIDLDYDQLVEGDPLDLNSSYDSLMLEGVTEGNKENVKQNIVSSKINHNSVCKIQLATERKESSSQMSVGMTPNSVLRPNSETNSQAYSGNSSPLLNPLLSEDGSKSRNPCSAHPSPDLKTRNPILKTLSVSPDDPDDKVTSRISRSNFPLSRSRSPLSRSQSPQSRSNSPQSRSTSPQSRSNSPQSRSTSPQSRSNSPQSRSTSPQSRSTSPQSRSISPQSRSISPQFRSISPQSRSQSPQSRSQSPQSRSQSPQSRSNNPQSRSRSYELKCLSPVSNSSSSQNRSSVSRRTSPQSRSQSPQSRSNSPQSRSNSPQSRSQSSQSRCLSPDSSSRSGSPVPSSRSHDPLSGATSPISRSITTDSKVRSPISKRERRRSLSNLPPYLVCGPESTNYALTKSLTNVVPSKTKSSASRGSSPLSNTSESEHNQTNSGSPSSLQKTQCEISSNICPEDRIENQVSLHITESHSNSQIKHSSLDFLTDELSSSGQSSSPQTSLANQLLKNPSKAASLPSISSRAEIKRRRRSNILRYDLFCKAILDTPQKTDCGKKILPNKWKTGENVDNSSAFSAKRKLSMGSDNPDIAENPAKMPRSDESDHGESPSIGADIDKSDRNSEKKKQAMTSEQRRKKKRLLSMKTSVLMSDCDETEVISSPPTFDDAYKDASKSKTNVASSVKSVRKKNHTFKLSTPSSSKNQTLVGDIYTEVKFGLESQMGKVCKYILKRTVPVGLLNQLYMKACRPNAEDRSTLLKYCPNLKVGKFLDREDSLIMKGYQQLVEQDLVTDKEKLLVEYAKIQTKTARARNILGLFVGQGILENRLAYDICDRLFVLLSGDPYFYQPYRKCEIRRSGKVGPYQKPQDKRNASRVKWTCDEDKQLLQHIINVTNTKAVEGINVTKTAWEMISEKIGRPVKLVRLHWLRILKPMLVLAEQDVPDDIDFKIKLFEAILDMNVKCRKEIDWIALEKNFPPRPSQALQNAYTSLIYRVDLPSHNEILQHCLRNLRMRKIDEDRRRLCNMVTEKEKHVKQVQEYYLSLIEN